MNFFKFAGLKYRNVQTRLDRRPYILGHVHGT